MTEQWKPIPGWDQLYEVSDYGRIRSLTRTTNGPLGFTRITKGRLLAQSKRRGYYGVTLKDKRRQQSAYVHRCVLLAFRGVPPEDHQACHNSGDRLDNRLENLRWDSLAA